MSVNYELYKIFISVASNKSFTKASRELFLSQPAVSQAIQKLENELKVTLFDREGKRSKLTDKGEQLYKFLTSGEHYFKNAASHIKYDESLGRLIIIAASQSLAKFFVIPKLNKLMESENNLQIEILDKLSSKERILGIENESIAFALMEEHNTILNSSVLTRQIGTLTYAFIYSKKYFNFANDVSITEILNNKIIVQNTGSAARNLFNEILPKNTNSHNIISVYYEENVLDAVKQGLGIGFAPIEYITETNFGILPLAKKEIKIMLIYKYHNHELARLL